MARNGHFVCWSELTNSAEGETFAFLVIRRKFFLKIQMVERPSSLEW